jgi:hypothetical protein
MSTLNAADGRFFRSYLKEVACAFVAGRTGVNPGLTIRRQPDWPRASRKTTSDLPVCPSGLGQRCGRIITDNAEVGGSIPNCPTRCDEHLSSHRNGPKSVREPSVSVTVPDSAGVFSAGVLGLVSGGAQIG